MYKYIVGSLIYMTITKLDLSDDVGLVSQFMQSQKKPHLDATRCILQYVKSILHCRLFYEVGRSIEVYGYTNVDWASSILDRDLLANSCFHLGVVL